MARKTTHLWAIVEEWLDSLDWAPSQAKLAERIGLKSRTVITDWKYGASRPTPEHLKDLAREMELTAGPDIYDRLVAAVVLDLGYDASGLQQAARTGTSRGRARRKQLDGIGEDNQDAGE